MFEILLNELEQENSNEPILYFKGILPILITAPHTMKQLKSDGTYKYSEPYTKALAKYISEELGTHYLIKVNDTGIDANSEELEEFKLKLIDVINENNIKLVIDLHGAKKERDFDVELGTLNNISADYSTIHELKEAFIENGVKNVEINNPFKGGGITRCVYLSTDAEAIQIEINGKYRDQNDIESIKKIYESLIQFIKQYCNFN